MAAASEKQSPPTIDSSPDVSVGSLEEQATHIASTNKLQRLANRLDDLFGLEARGVERVPESARQHTTSIGDYFQMFIIWFSINCTANNMTVGILGPVVYSLGITDAIVCCLFGTIFGSCCTAYISTFGPVSGLRTLIVARYTMGWWPSKICVLLNLVIELGYGVVDVLVAGLILSAVNGGGMTVIVGIVISALITWVVATFGIKWFHAMERWIWIPTVLVLFVFIGVAGPHFDTSTGSAGSGVVLAGSRISYFFLTASGPLGWSSAAADFYSYFPPRTNKWLVFGLTATGITSGKLLIEFLGIGLGTGLGSNPAWATAFSTSGAGALITEAFAPLGGFGKFCAVVLALCIAANNVPGTYAAALNWQMFGRVFAAVPRFIWSTLSVLIFTAAAIGGRAQLFSIFLNFLGLIGYWTITWITITFEEQVIFRRKTGYDWTLWNRKDHLPIGYAALTAFLIGWAGAILGMYQTYYTGVIAAMVGHGADLGLPIALAWSAIAYPPLRYLEMKMVGR